MEEHRDEQIHCADCGTPFFFSADEAKVFAQRGLTAPKRCKDCRRARKERAANAGPTGPRRTGSWDARGARAPRYTGDVNEYRSPMQDGFSASRHPGILTGGNHAPRRPWNAAPAPQGGADGRSEYRSPMQDRTSPRGQQHRDDFGNSRGGRSRGGFGAPGRDVQGGRPQRAPHPSEGAARDAGAAPAEPKPPRRQKSATMFAITCNACGAQAEVPFQPAEGREVYCPTCYRARRAPAAG